MQRSARLLTGCEHIREATLKVAQREVHARLVSLAELRAQGGFDVCEAEQGGTFRKASGVLRVEAVIQIFDAGVKRLIDGDEHWTRCPHELAASFSETRCPVVEQQGAATKNLMKPSGLKAKTSLLMTQATFSKSSKSSSMCERHAV